MERKPVYFTVKGGVLVPHILLFGRQPDGNVVKLPITKVIVGPHPDRLKRQKAVALLLEQYEIEAKTIVSDIPYISR